LIAALDRGTDGILRVPHSAFSFALQNVGDYVVDVGLEHIPSKRRFDHHQFGKHGPCEAAFVLVARFFGMTDCESIFQWWQLSSEMDVHGPHHVAKEFGLLPDVLFALMSPIEAQLLRMFEQHEIIDGQFFALMRSMGIGWSEYQFNTLMARKEYADKAKVFNSGTVKYLETTDIPVDRQNAAVARQKALDNDCAVIVSLDPTGAGLSLFRVDDHPAVDFAQLENDPAILFAHKGGFIAKTHEREADVDQLICRAVDISQFI
jgi:hypothetical protein